MGARWEVLLRVLIARLIIEKLVFKDVLTEKDKDRGIDGEGSRCNFN